jgi:multidrug efflux pump subunit AcrA (membrane-fusion protein)
MVGQDGRAQQRVVVPGANQGKLVVIDKGVAVGDQVIVGNLQKIAVGAQVRPEPSKDGTE